VFGFHGENSIFQQEYKDVDMSWITHFTDFSIQAVEHEADTYKKTRNKKTLETVLLPITMFDDLKENIENQVQLVCKDVLRRVFQKYAVCGFSRGKMLLDFLESDPQDKFLCYLVQNKGKGNHVFMEESITEELNNAFLSVPI
jgi:hypothetical protein